jgi:hypothetical protein
MEEHDEQNHRCSLEISVPLPPAIVHCQFVGEPVVNVTVFVGQPIVVCEGFEKPGCPAHAIDDNLLRRDSARQSGCPLAPIFDALDGR